MPAVMYDTERSALAMQQLRAAVGMANGQGVEGKALEAAMPPPTATPSSPASAPPLGGAPPPGPPPGRPDQPWREDPDYDPFAERVVRLPYSNLGAVAHLLKSATGAGLLAIALGFKKSGLAVGLVSAVAIAVVCTHCCTMLVQGSRAVCRRLRVPSLDFPSTVEAAFLTGPARLRRFAKPCRALVNFLLCFTYLGLPIIFIIVISSSAQELVQYYTNVNLDVRYYILMLLPFVLGMGLIRELKWLVPLSHASNTLFVCGLSITVYYLVKDMPSPLSVRQYGSLQDYPLFLSAMIYGMENIGVIMPVENTMRRPEHLVSGQQVLILAMTIIALAYTFMGAVGFIAFGEKTRENIILNLPLEETAAQVVKVLIPFGILLSYGLQLYVVPVTIWGGIRHRVPEGWHNVGLSSVRAGTVIFTVLVALVVPNLQPVLTLVGAVGFSSLGLLFPTLVDLVVAGAGASRLRIAKNVLIVVFWLIALLSGTYSALLEIRDAYFGAPQASS